MIQTMQSELFRIRKSRLFWACLVLAAFFVFALALTFYHNSVNGMLPVISLVSFTEFLFSDYSLIFPLTLFLCLYFTEDFHTGTYSITLSKGTSRVHLFFGKLLASWGGVLFFLFVCFGVAYLSILMMGASRYDIEYSFSAIGVFLLFQCLCFLGYTAFLNLLSYLLRHRIIVTITAFFMLGVLYLYLTKISTALDMDYSLYERTTLRRELPQAERNRRYAGRTDRRGKDQKIAGYGAAAYLQPLAALIAGGNWNNGANCGARAVNCNNYPWNVNTNIGARGACDLVRTLQAQSSTEYWQGLRKG